MQANVSEDYVMVDFDLGSVVGSDDLPDDDSYDYCDDMDSVHSNGDQSNASESEGENSVLSVPSGLLKELDEAHAAAKLAIPHDSEDVTTVQSSQSVTICATDESEKDAQFNSLENEGNGPIEAVPVSRLSNKKRRKQLKLMKKAKAAAQASKALSEKAARMATSSASAVSSSKPVSKAKAAAKKGRSKKVHPHVACAHEEIAAYHEEVRMTNKKVL